MKPTYLSCAAVSVMAGALAWALPAAAQPQSWQQGQKPDQAASPLAPHAPALTAKAAKDIPIDKLKLPAGFEASVWARGIPNARSLAQGPKGTVFVGSRLVG